MPDAGDEFCSTESYVHILRRLCSHRPLNNLFWTSLRHSTTLNNHYCRTNSTVDYTKRGREAVADYASIFKDFTNVDFLF
jgi:hypothetical protein